jgi:spore coat protein U-like protein
MSKPSLTFKSLVYSTFAAASLFLGGDNVSAACLITPVPIHFGSSVILLGGGSFDGPTVSFTVNCELNTAKSGELNYYCVFLTTAIQSMNSGTNLLSYQLFRDQYIAAFPNAEKDGVFGSLTNGQSTVIPVYSRISPGQQNDPQHSPSGRKQQIQ